MIFSGGEWEPMGPHDDFVSFGLLTPDEARSDYAMAWWDRVNRYQAEPVRWTVGIRFVRDEMTSMVHMGTSARR